jgi:hypothetical protein
MNYVRTLIASAIFVAVTAIKLISPGFAMEIRGELAALLDADTDYKSAISALGKSLSGSEFLEALGVADTLPAGPEDRSTPVDLDIKSAEELAYSLPVLTPEDRTDDNDAPETDGENAAYPSAASVPEPDSEKAENDDPQDAVSGDTAEEQKTEETPVTPGPDADDAAAGEENDAVAAFLDSQAAFAGYEIPYNVRCDMPVLPFAYSNPLKSGSASGFGYRMHPLLNEIKFHYGTDMAAQSGDDIYAFADGVVSMAGEEETYGNYVILDHGNGYATLYAHCSLLYVEAGQRISAGDKIALVGATGRGTGPHLHFELRCDGEFLNPEYYLSVV